MTASNSLDSPTLSNDDSSHFFCPICDSAFLPGQSNRLHGLFHRSCDDVLIAVLCNSCSKEFFSPTRGDSHKQLLKQRIERHIRGFVYGQGDDKEWIAITTEKVLIQNNLDVHLALRRGWTLLEPPNSFHVTIINGEPTLEKSSGV